MMPRFAAVVPEAHVECGSPHDVAEALAYAERNGLEVTVRSGGHDFAGRSTTDGVVIDVSPMRGVAVAGEIAALAWGIKRLRDRRPGDDEQDGPRIARDTADAERPLVTA